MKLEISLFRFDKDSDYLPYYTKHFIKIENEKTVLDLLETCDTEENLSYQKLLSEDFVFNGVFVKGSSLIVDIVNKVGKDITIEPISIRRATKDFIIDDNDFWEKLISIEKFVHDEERLKYRELKPYYYASETINHEYDYIGDGVLILASQLVKNKAIENDLLKTLSQYQIGASYHTSLENKFLHFDSQIEEDIKNLQVKLGIYEEIEKQNFRIENTLILNFGFFEEKYEIKHDFKDFNICYYSENKKDNVLELLDKLNANILNYETKDLKLAKNTYNADATITNKIATKIILDAFDNNADFLLVDNDEDFYIFDYNRKTFGKISGRDVLLPVIHINELQKLAMGNHDEVKKTLSKHKIDPEII